MGTKRPPSLTRQRDISHLFRTGKRLPLKWCTIVMTRAPDDTSRILVAVGRKIGNAVRRNRARRRLRELGRLLAAQVAGAWWIGLIGRPGVEEAPWRQLVGEGQRAVAEVCAPSTGARRRHASEHPGGAE